MVGLELSNFGDNFQAPASYHILAYTSLLVIKLRSSSLFPCYKCVQPYIVHRFDFIVIRNVMSTSIAAVALPFGMRGIVRVVMYSLQAGKNRSGERRSLHERNNTHGIPVSTTNRTDESG